MVEEKDFKCPYNQESNNKEFLDSRNIEPCKAPCPINGQTCYRWEICFMAKDMK